MNKKAQTADNFFIMIKFFAFALLLLVISVVWTNLSTSDMDEALWDQSTIGQGIKADAQRAMNNWDWIAVLVYFGLHLGVIAMAFLLRSHPVVYVAGILLIVILVMVAAPLSNAWEETIQEPDLANEITTLPKVNYLMNNLPKFEMIWGFLTLIVLAGLAKQEGMY